MKCKKRWILAGILMLLLTEMMFLGFRIRRNTGSGFGEYREYKKHYALITGTGNDGFWNTLYESARDEGEKKDIYVERFGARLALQYDRNDLLKLAIQAQVDGIIVPGDEDKETVALIDEAVNSGIPVVTVLNDSTGSARQCFVGNNNYDLGQEYGKQIEALVREKETDRQKAPVRVLVLLDEARLDISQNLILLGIRETLDQRLGDDNRVQVETVPVDNTREFSSEESIRDIFLDDEKLPDIMVCLSELHTRCAFQAAVDYNKVGIVEILGYYDSQTVLEAVAKDIIHATIAPNTDQMGRFCVQALDEYQQTGYTNGYMAVETSLITSQKADQLLKDMGGELP